ncbi:MAG: uracil-DNA glycosylase family protein [Acidobacteria bacterium]|nr:uracil-DNA glycosylase family protein [Acidobacteriota bacterium]NIM60115.1 uracil-DNA glycosylase family protein [Acidobacteriota bacterium]NIO57784.1 uracil-DNA glycosylase family protein [Acidobacteriota bacterium]NIQ28793.1 uracil-DNA glycosylase family protein [Acidobacteriota bacterium]NIQ83251.1 uracil-DNA glycosylase family protein [Acidobacteriota bacterium]
MALEELLKEVRACTACAGLPLGPRPVLAAARSARILVVGQAPGTRVHETGVPWNDPSGDRLRSWMNVDRETFYDTRRIAIVPMGFCYPGRGKSGDLPPRPECAPLWHERILRELPHLELKILAGSYAQAHYLAGRVQRTLTETVRASEEYGEDTIPLPHPSPRNNLWLRKNPWFEERLVPRLQSRVRELLD